MVRQLAAFLWSASILAVLAAPQNESSSVLSERDIRNSQLVVEWLKDHGLKVDQKEAKGFYSDGLKTKEARNWSAATKAFGESMIRYPSPQAISEYTDALLNMLGDIRTREGAALETRLRDMSVAISLYESAIAANGVTHSLLDQDENRITHYIVCLKEYVKTARPSNDCPPSLYFSSGKVTE